MQRKQFKHNGLNFSYLDSGGNNPVIIALHAHWMEGAGYIPFSQAVASEWRVVALDQRGHGYSDHAPSYAREDYLGDLVALFKHLNLSKAVLLGNSLGGINAFQYAVRHPEQVEALVIEDIGVVITDDVSFVSGWQGKFQNREELEARIGPRLSPYLVDSFRHDVDGWHMAFDPQDMIESQRCTNGDYWQDWLASTCPALLLRGRESRLTNAELFEAMAAKRPNTRLITLEGGHAIHQDNLAGFVDAVKTFLQETARA